MSLVKVRLLNDGGFNGFVDTKFPVVVMGQLEVPVVVMGQLEEDYGAVIIKPDELARVGYDVYNYMDDPVNGKRTFVLGTEAVLI